MARAQIGTGFFLVVGLVAGAATAAAQAPNAAPSGPEPVVRATNPHAALNDAIEAQRRGDYENAALLLQGAAAGQALLTTTEQQELTRLLQDNGTALQARRVASAQLQTAVQALRDRRQTEAAEMLKRVAVNEQYLNAADRQTFRQCCAPGADATRMANSAAPQVAGVDRAAQARLLVRQGRAALIQGDFDLAEQKARDAASLQVEFAKNEDSPVRVFDDLAKAHSDANALLKAARAALARKDYDKADLYAHQSQMTGSGWTLTFFGDTPAKAIKDIAAARAAAPMAAPVATRPANDPYPVVQTSTAPPVPSAPAKSGKNTDDARALLAQARKAMDAGDLLKASKLIEQARALKPELQWFEDNPDKLSAEVARAEARTNPGSAAMNKNMNPAEAKTAGAALLKQGRTQLAQNKLDAAFQTLAQLRALPTVSWGLFEDSPERLRQDVEAAHQKQDMEESVKLLAEARKLMQNGQFEDAQRAAYRAQKLHGPYKTWDFGDRPDKVLADLDTARLHYKGAPMQSAVAATNKPPDKMTASPANGVQVAVHQTTDAPPHLTQPAVNLPPVPGTTIGTAAAPLVGPAKDANRAKADQLLAEVGRLERENKLLEAHQKAKEAVQLRATFGPNEESPDYALQQCAFLGRREIARLMVHATETINYSGGDPVKNCAQAEQDLLQARELANGFGQDGQPVELKLTWVRQVRAIVLKQPAPTPTAATASSAQGPQNEGLTKLEMARRELTRGSTATARKLAEEVCSGPYNLAAEGQSLLRSIDAEEFAQQCRQDQKTFDAANSAYNRRDYKNAGQLLAAIDVRRLDEARAARWRELLRNPGMASGTVQLASADGTGAGSRETTPMPQPGHSPDDAAAGHAHIADDSAASLLKTTEAMRQVKFQQLRKDGLELQSKAQEKVGAGQTSAAIDILQDYLAGLDKEEIDPQQLALLRGPVEKRLQKYKILKIEEDARTADNSKNDAVLKNQHDRMTAQQVKEENVAQAMKRFNDNFRDGHYAEAEQAAMEAHDLDPDNTTATAAMTMAKYQKNIQDSRKRRDDRGEYALKALGDADDFGPAVDDKNPLRVDPAVERANRGRNLDKIPAPVHSEKEREIERKLTTPVTALNFTDAKLGQVLDDLRAWENINIYIDQKALDAQGVSLEHPVSVKLENISLKSALNLILKQVQLTWIIKDEVLQITTDAEAKGKMKRVTYEVADLVIPVPNSTNPLPMNNANNSTQPIMAPYAPTPIVGKYALGTGTPTGEPSPSSFATETGGATVTKTGPTTTREAELIKLITNTIDPRSWSDLGGPGTIDYHPLTMGLVVNQTPDIQEQIVDLLNSLRRLQDQEVALEVRFISISDDFFERIGVDFALNVTNQTANADFGPQLVSGQFQPAGFINAFHPSRFISGLSGPNQLTSDLGIPINNPEGGNTFLNTIPQFGGYVPGFTLGLAFLSQIQVFLFMEAVQGDNRVNVMQAPRITAFNGQTATLAVVDNQTFVTNVNITIGPNGNPIFTPVIQNSGNALGGISGSGITLTIQPVISADRRFVRLNFGNPFGGGGGVTLTNMVPGPVATFPVVVPVFSGSSIQDPTAQVVFTQLIQQPVSDIINIDTTVSVPDGGTVVMGGLKRLSESRSEYGPPILSKIPYINRLFKNVGYGRSAESLLIMVTPRIIIQEEEEERQTGFHLETQEQ